ncbi:MAG: hypothetical protein DLM53_00135 [Candidatus Eremiobacter antarcticus]|nr:MAG: hypothetical protein DLM53_00135 [Candidatus Eremiobacter sp. RRmetagenome_bin22]
MYAASSEHEVITGHHLLRNRLVDSHRTLLIGILWLLAWSPLGNAAPSVSDAVSGYMTKELHSTNIPGAQISVHLRHKLVFQRAYGMANVDGRIPMSPDTTMLIASNTKMFTAFALQLLAQDHRVALDGPIARYVPELPPKVGQVTLRQLLSNMGGVKDSAADFGSHDDSALAAAIAKWDDGYLFHTPGDVFRTQTSASISRDMYSKESRACPIRMP